MEKKIIVSAAFEALHNSNIVFTKDNFAKDITTILHNHKLGLHEKSIDSLIKQLSAKDYLDQKDNFLIKTEKSLTHSLSKQGKLVDLLLEEYANEFDLHYIKELYIKNTLSDEQTPAYFKDLLSESFDSIIENLAQNKKIRHIDEFEQVEIIK